jgi:hypothetical protein
MEHHELIRKVTYLMGDLRERGIFAFQSCLDAMPTRWLCLLALFRLAVSHVVGHREVCRMERTLMRLLLQL